MQRVPLWHLGYDTMVTSECGTPNMVKDGVNPELLLGGKYGHKLHVFVVSKADGSVKYSGSAHDEG